MKKSTIIDRIIKECKSKGILVRDGMGTLESQVRPLLHLTPENRVVIYESAKGNKVVMGSDVFYSLNLFEEANCKYVDDWIINFENIEVSGDLSIKVNAKLSDDSFESLKYLTGVHIPVNPIISFQIRKPKSLSVQRLRERRVVFGKYNHSK